MLASVAARGFTEAEAARFMAAHPSRAYFAHLSRGLVVAEIGVAQARFSEHLLLHARPSRMYLIEPFPHEDMMDRLSTSWKVRGIGNATDISFLKGFSLDQHVLSEVPPASVDFVYLDGAHDYENVKKEMGPYWDRVAPGGILAGHDYCNRGEATAACSSCRDVPRCGTYTPFGVKNGKKPGNVANQVGVVKAVQEWVTTSHPELRIHHTLENFTRASLRSDGYDFDLVITMTRNPSWWIFKPRKGAK